MGSQKLGKRQGSRQTADCSTETPPGTYELMVRAVTPLSEIIKGMSFALYNRNTTANAEAYYQHLTSLTDDISDLALKIAAYREPPEYKYKDIWIFKDKSILVFVSFGNRLVVYKNISAAISGLGLGSYGQQVLRHYKLASAPRPGKFKKKRKAVAV